MELLAKVGLVVTSYEITKKGRRPVVSHIFWGENIEEALGYALPHLVTDYFFSSTFIGKMAWKGGELTIEYDGALLGMKRIDKLDRLLDQLDARAHELHNDERLLTVSEILQELT